MYVFIKEYQLSVFFNSKQDKKNFQNYYQNICACSLLLNND